MFVCQFRHAELAQEVPVHFGAEMGQAYQIVEGLDRHSGSLFLFIPRLLNSASC